MVTNGVRTKYAPLKTYIWYRSVWQSLNPLYHTSMVIEGWQCWLK